MTAADVYLRTHFLERVSHELRGPVGVTSGALDEIEAAMGPGAESLQTYFRMARRGMERVLRVSERLHRAALLEGGAIEWQKVPADLRTLAEAAAKETEALEARRAVQVTVSCSEAKCPVVVDSDWIHTALGELVGNAIRFAQSVVTVHTAPTGDEVSVTITDDGPGFSGTPEARFAPSSEKRGVGLSLPLVRDVVASHGGRIEIRAGVAAGASVVLVLPRRLENAP